MLKNDPAICGYNLFVYLFYLYEKLKYLDLSKERQNKITFMYYYQIIVKNNLTIYDYDAFI